MPRWQRTPSATRVHRSSAASTGAYSERRRFVTSPSSGRNGEMSSLTLVRFSPSKRPLHNRSDLPIPETIDDVIVHHSNRLHVRINDRRADEAESPELEVLAECVGFGKDLKLRGFSFVGPTVVYAYKIGRAHV